MSLKIVKIEAPFGRFVLIMAAIICVICAYFFAKWNFANAVASHLDSQRPGSLPVAEWLAQTAPDDPQTHFAAAVILEKTFNPGDLASSLAEYETAVSLSPHNYLLWLNLGRARNLNGDIEGSNAALKRALELAPNYAAVQWAYGNSLVRQGNTGEGFALMAKAAASNPQYSRNAAVSALQIFDGDIAAARQALGDSSETNSALASALADASRLPEAFSVWSLISQDEMASKYKGTGESLARRMIAAKEFSLAARITAGFTQNAEVRPEVGQIANGGFENGVKTSAAGAFEWSIADGAEPQIGLSDAQKHSGKYGLFMLFNTFEAGGFRPVSITAAVESGRQYELEFFYLSDIKSTLLLKWQIVDAESGVVLASTPALFPAKTWTPVVTKFAVPAGSDGVVFRFVREGCLGVVCPINGRISFDDFSLRQF